VNNGGRDITHGAATCHYAFRAGIFRLVAARGGASSETTRTLTLFSAVLSLCAGMYLYRVWRWSCGICDHASTRRRARSCTWAALEQRSANGMVALPHAARLYLLVPSWRDYIHLDRHGALGTDGLWNLAKRGVSASCLTPQLTCSLLLREV
jgi:hypothetical protein